MSEALQETLYGQDEIDGTVIYPGTRPSMRDSFEKYATTTGICSRFEQDFWGEYLDYRAQEAWEDWQRAFQEREDEI